MKAHNSFNVRIHLAGIDSHPYPAWGWEVGDLAGQLAPKGKAEVLEGVGEDDEGAEATDHALAIVLVERHGRRASSGGLTRCIG
jgi:hypothetical protein